MKNRNQDLTVALLLDDIRDAKALSEIFKKMGVIPFFYESLKTFWHGVLDKKPTLSIVDVKKMSEGDRLLRSHPFVKTDKIPLAFFFSKETEPLLISTHDFFHLGLIRKEWNLENQLKSLVIRVNKMLADARELEATHIRNKTLEGQVTKLLGAFESGKQELFYQDRLRELMVQFETIGTNADFFESIDTVFTAASEIEKFTYLELNQAGQKLITPVVGGKKFMSVPSLWLGEACGEGIANFAQEMAQQVSIELMGTDLISIYVKGSRQFPEKIIIVKPSSIDALNTFDWDGLETYLSGYFSAIQLRFKKVITRKDKYMSPWELMGELDRQFYGQLATEQRTIPETEEDVLTARERENILLLNINLSHLVSFIRSGKGYRFYWNQFFQDFVNRLESQSKINLKIISYGVDNINIIAGKEFTAELFDFVKQFTSQFSYWKYFEDTDVALTAQIKPKVEMVPLSPRAYLNFMESHLDIASMPMDNGMEIVRDARKYISSESINDNSTPEAILYQSAIDNFDNDESEIVVPTKKKYKSLRTSGNSPSV